MEISRLNAAVLMGGKFLDASDKKRKKEKKRAFPIKERQVPLQSADNKTSRNMKLFTSLTLLLTVQSDQLPVFCVLHLSKQTAACKENVK